MRRAERIVQSIKLLTAAACIGATAGCSTFSTQVGSSVTPKGASTVPIEDGLVYFMPSRSFKVTASYDKDTKVWSATVSAGDTVPDLSQRFILRYNRNWVGTNHAVLAVNSKGLLQTSSSQTTSSVSQIAASIGTMGGDLMAAVGARPMMPNEKAAPAAPAKCEQGRTYVRIFDPAAATAEQNSWSICDFTVKAVLLPSAVLAVLKDSERVNKKTEFQDGVFYKRDLPYLVTITDPMSANTSDYQVYSPNKAPVSYYPLPHSAFAAAGANLTLADGALTGVDETSDSEILAVVQLPAAVVSAYFTAVGQIFSSIGTGSGNRATAITNEQSVILEKIQLQKCRDAFATNDPTGKTGSDKDAAVAAIVTACGKS